MCKINFNQILLTNKSPGDYHRTKMLSVVNRVSATSTFWSSKFEPTDPIEALDCQKWQHIFREKSEKIDPKWTMSSTFVIPKLIINLKCFFEKKKKLSDSEQFLFIRVVILSYISIQSDELFPKADIKTVWTPYLLLRRWKGYGPYHLVGLTWQNYKWICAT